MRRSSWLFLLFVILVAGQGLVLPILVIDYSHSIIAFTPMNMQWEQIYGEHYDYSRISAVVECSGGGYALAGATDGLGAGNFDVWLIRTDSSGNPLWNITWGGPEDDSAQALVECSGGGFVLAGYTRSFGSGLSDVLLLRVDANGNAQWAHVWGGTEHDGANAIIEHSSGGFAIAGYTRSFGVGYSDVWLIRTNSAGTLSWTMTYGGAGSEEAQSIVECSDGGFAIGADSTSFGDGDRDLYIIRTNQNGAEQWSYTYGTDQTEDGAGLVLCSDGGFAIAGQTMQTSQLDFILIRTDADGTELWQRIHGGWSDDLCRGIVAVSGGGFALTGGSISYGSGGGDRNVWLLRLDSDGNHLWSSNYGGTLFDDGASIIECTGGGFAIGGTHSWTYGSGLAYLVRVADEPPSSGIIPGFPWGAIIIALIISISISLLKRKKCHDKKDMTQ